jgi:hypothetical protein
MSISWDSMCGSPQDPRPYELAWYACDATTGGIVEELPGLTTQNIGRRLGSPTTSSSALFIPSAPSDWEAATQQGRAMLLAVDPVTDTPLWAGLILTRDGGSSQTVDLQAITFEGYLDRRYVGDLTLIGQDQATVITNLMAAPLSQGPPFVMDTVATGVTMDWISLDADDRTVLSAMQQVMGMDGGPEWTVDPIWADAAHTAINLAVRVRSQIGSQSGDPEAVFDFPGCIASYRQTESYETGKGATVVTARGDGEGESRLTSAPQIAAALEAAGWPRTVYRWTPASGITDPAQLTAHAVRALALMGTGSSVWTIDATASRAPRLGTDWSLGDDITIEIAESARHPAGAVKVGRAWSWDLDPSGDRISPILVEEEEI